MAANSDDRKTRLSDLLRATASAFIQASEGSSPSEDTLLRSEVDCLLSLWQGGQIDPVSEFRSRRDPEPSARMLPPPAAQVPLH